MGSGNDSILDMYLYETNTLLEQLDGILLAAEQADTFSEDSVNEIFRIMHTIKGSSAMMEFSSLMTVAHRIEDLFFVIREKTIDVMASPYVSFALARGESKLSVILHHGLRNLALPAITIQFAQVSEIFGGSVLVEQVFSYPGLGQAAVTAGIGGGGGLLAGIALVSAALVFGGNLIANILYGIIDPRMRLGVRTQRMKGEGGDHG